MMEQIFTQQINVDRFIHSLVNALIRLSWIVSETIFHLNLMFKMWPSAVLYLETLESVDLDFGRPDLSPIKRYSIYGLIYALFTVSFSFFKKLL
jgi:hypothetical protein